MCFYSVMLELYTMRSHRHTQVFHMFSHDTSVTSPTSFEIFTPPALRVFLPPLSLTCFFLLLLSHFLLVYLPCHGRSWCLHVRTHDYSAYWLLCLYHCPNSLALPVLGFAPVAWNPTLARSVFPFVCPLIPTVILTFFIRRPLMSLPPCTLSFPVCRWRVPPRPFCHCCFCPALHSHWPSLALPASTLVLMPAPVSPFLLHHILKHIGLLPLGPHSYISG